MTLRQPFAALLAVGLLAADAAVAQATPDGHTLTITSTGFAITAVLQGKGLPYDALKDFRAVSMIGTTTGTLAVAPALGVKPEEYDRQLRSQIEIFTGVAKAVGLIPK